MKQISEAVKKDQILYYFKTQWPVLLAVTISGLIYNLGLLAGPWFEGRMTRCLVDILGGKAGYRDMLVLVTAYVISIAIVQISRYIKRFYVRRFANNVNRDMKGDPVPQPGAQKPCRTGRRGCRKCDDQGNPGCGRLRGGYAEIYHRDLRYRCGTGSICGDAVIL